jgi:hypothetical protein
MNFSSRFGLRNANRVRGRIETIIAKNVDVDDKDFRNPAEFTALHEQAGRPPRNNPNYKSNEKTSPDMFIAKLLERKCCENLQREPLHPDFHPMVRDKRHQKRQRSNDGKSGPRGPRPVPLWRQSTKGFIWCRATPMRPCSGRASRRRCSPTRRSRRAVGRHLLQALASF